ncbi:MAG: hypothetical protein K8R60_06330 [Burkholderiales bacterium]|nr:hypothetical protein [Burkholderiales bacterium]
MSEGVLRLANEAPLGTLSVLGLAAALVAGLAAFVFLGKTAENDGMIVLGVAAVGLVGLWYAGTWFEVTIDPARREVVSRIGYLGLGVGTTHPFADYSAVVVTLKRGSESEAVTSVGSGFSKVSSRTRTTYSYALSLVGPVATLDLPLQGDGKTPDEAETRALEVARVGGWPARRRGYAFDARADGPVHRDVAFDAESALEAPRRELAAEGPSPR